MSDSRMRKIHPMLSLDIENYTGRNEAEQFQAQKSLTGLVETAMREAGVDLNDCWPQFSGDGLFAVLPADTQMDRFAETFIEELIAHSSTKTLTVLYLRRLARCSPASATA
mgnify:CR=1 FL=1